MSKISVSKDQAVKEVNSWLDNKRVGDKKREDYKDQIDIIVDGLSAGYLRIDSDFNIIHTLSFAVGDNGDIRELTYKPRISVGDIENRMKGVKNGDGDGRVKAYISALCGQSSNVLRLLDSCDYSIPQSIIVFFI